MVDVEILLDLVVENKKSRHGKTVAAYVKTN